MKQAYRYLSILFILFFVVDTMRADGGDVLERIVRLPKTKGTVYSLLGNVSQQSGYMFIYDSKVIDNDAVVKIKGGERSIRQAVYDIVGDTGLEFQVIGTHILIDDGLIELQVTSISGEDILCTVITGGPVSNHKGINVPDVHLNMPYLSEVDQSDILFGIEQDVDFIAASFVRSAKDVLEIRELLNANGGNNINIISKIENSEGVNHIDDIIYVSDGIMVARGDMGVEIPCEEVPVIQKMIINKVYMAGKQVITATQMLDSMMKHPRPTRAEATDVANAVYDGTSAIMLSGETAAGDYPVEALQTMVKIASRTEQDINYMSRLKKRSILTNPDITNAIAHATCTTAMDLNASAIITVSNSGSC